MNTRIFRPTVLTFVAAGASVAAIAGTAGFLIGRYPLLHQFIPVHFSTEGVPDRWQMKSYTLVLMPVWVQLILAAAFAAIAALLLYRARPANAGPAAGGSEDAEGQAARQYRQRMLIAVESIGLLGAIWVSFQAVAALRIMTLWQRGWGGLGPVYGQSIVVALVLSVVVGIRAAAYLRQGSAQAQESRTRALLRGIYFSPEDPSLFVPLPSGMGWTLNFGRPGAILLMALFLFAGIGGPLIVMEFLLGE
jgi:uncharacterized membrane protein